MTIQMEMMAHIYIIDLLYSNREGTGGGRGVLSFVASAV